MTGFLAIAVIVVLAVVLLRASFTKVPREANWTVERLGRFNRVLTPGFHFIVPVVERIGARLDMRETALDMPPQRAMTRDNAAVEAGAVLGYRIVDAVKATYEVADLQSALIQLVGTHMRDVTATRTIAELATDRAAVNAALLQGVEPAADALGVQVSRLELKGIMLPD
ncbi:paraslipin [Vineibacter terrae]|uniref:SPFH domain-containing protein n=1 Tax=Vineibacter terrae TaxID=2586908 RepID=UPI002E31020B|nr:paraslipin [Vineibacter terrae]HEX2885108.1 paraslipin [Vineibacter terrae]